MEIGIFVYVTIAGVFYVLVEYITIGRDIYVSKGLELQCLRVSSRFVCIELMGMSVPSYMRLSDDRRYMCI